jgi:coniferyl-aldehyde dehydrogenase
MALTENRTASTADDSAAIAELHEIVDRQRAAFLADPFPTLEQRLELLGALAGMLIGHREQIQEAMSSDFAVHPTVASDMIEILGVAGRAGYVAENLAAWMAPEPRHADPAFYGSGRAYVQPQPKGVIGQSGRHQAVGVRARLRTAASGHDPCDVRSRSRRRRRR